MLLRYSAFCWVISYEELSNRDAKHMAYEALLGTYVNIVIKSLSI